MERKYNLLLFLILCMLSMDSIETKEIIETNNLTESSDEIEETHGSVGNDKQNLNVKGVKNYKNETFVFNGLLKYESVPIIFPKDICLLNIDTVRFAACLHLNETDHKNFVIFKYNAQIKSYEKIFTLPAPFAIAMDCKSYNSKGYIALASNFTESKQQISEGSPIFEVTKESEVKIVQYFVDPFLRSVQFVIRGAGFFLTQTFQNPSGQSIHCPIFKWSGSFFDIMDKIPCQYAKHIEVFQMNSQIFAAVANYANQYNQIDTESTIYSYNITVKKFILMQTIKTSAAIDVKYFKFSHDNNKHHFIVFANSMQSGLVDSKTNEAFSVFYKYENERFIPFQQLLLYSVRQFLPIYTTNGEFVLMIACENQDIKLLHYNGWNFEETANQLTDGALSGGISKMRLYKDINETYIVVANEKMLMNATNIYKPIFKKEENIKNLKLEIMEWCEKMYKKFSKINVENLLESLEKIQKFKRNEINGQNFTEFATGNIMNAFTRRLIFPKRNMTASLWATLKYAQRAINAIEEKIKTEFASQPTESTLTIKTLTVTDDIRVENVNNISVDALHLDTINANEIIIQSDQLERSSIFTNRDNEESKPPNSFDLLSVKNLNVSGLINDINFGVLNDRLLKTVGDQIILQPITVNKLKVNSIYSRDGLANGFSTSQIVRIDNGSYVISKDIQFAKTIYVNNLTILERLNNIVVRHGQLDILLLNSSKPQFLSGETVFENVEILEPVTLEGKIHGPILDRMKPIAPIHDDINLVGDYIINGKVSIKNLLSADNIYGNSEDRNMNNLLMNGLSAETTEIPIKMDFTNKIFANNINFHTINGRKIEDFVRGNTDEFQYITATKTFKNDLEIVNGFCEMNKLNDVDIEKLNVEIMRKFGDQNITGHMEFKDVIVPRVFFDKILIGTKNIEEILTTSTKQEIDGKYVIGNATIKNANVAKLKTQNAIYNADLDELLRNLLTNEKSKLVITENFTHFGDIKVKNLYIGSTINSKPIKDFENLLKLSNEKIIINETVKFDKDLFIENINFHGKINGISAEEFGRSWLLSEFDQVFTAPQIMSSIKCDSGLQILNTLNEIKFENFITQTYWVDREEHLMNVTFDKSITLQNNSTFSGPINGIDFTRDILLSQSSEPQECHEPFVVNDNVYVIGAIENLEKINEIDLIGMNAFLTNKNDKIYVHNAIFENQPKFGTINSKNLINLLDEIWMNNVDVNLTGQLQFTDIISQNEIVFKGLVNNLDLNYIKDNYFSLTKSQDISTHIKFKNDVIFEEDFTASYVQLESGRIIDIIDNVEMNFDDFVAKTFRRTEEQQTVTGQWNAHRAYVDGDMKNVRINGLRLSDDVMRSDVPINNITAPKFIESAFIEDLICDEFAKVNHVNMHNWWTNAALNDRNNTIHGTITMDALIAYNDITVDGLVNGFKFNENNLLLNNKKPQTIHGNVFVNTKFLETKEILTNSINSLNSKNINNLNVNEFFENIWQKNPENNLNISTDLDFKSSVKVENFDGNDYLYDLNTKEYFENLRQLTMKPYHKMENLNLIIAEIQRNYGEARHYLEHFEKRQFIFGSIQKVISFPIMKRTDLIAVLTRYEIPQVDFYKWDSKQQIFIMDQQLSCQSNIAYQPVVDVTSLNLNGVDFLAIETYINGNFIQHLFMGNEFQQLQKVFELTDKVSFTLMAIQHSNKNQKDCLITYSKENPIIATFCPGQTGEYNVRSDIQITPFKQLIPIQNSQVSILVHDGIEIWNLNGQKQNLHQKIVQFSPAQMTSASYEENIFIAVMSAKQNQDSLHFGSVEIYKSTNNSMFEHFQFLEIYTPIKIEFMEIRETDDLLLFILTDNSAQPFVIYQYQGVLGFVKIVEGSTVPKGHTMNTLHLKAAKRYFTAVAFDGGVTFIESVLHQA